MFGRSLLFALTLACAGPAAAVDFGVMEAGDVVDYRDFKVEAFPLSVRDGSTTRDQDAGITLGAGYGFFPNFDAEVQVASYDDLTWVGGDVEYTFYDDFNVELSIGSGAHYGDTEFGNPWGLDATHIASYTLPMAPRVKLNGGFDLAYEEVETEYARMRGLDDDYYTAHFVPGAQFRAGRQLDLIAELGIGLNGEATDYIGAGLAYYFNRRY